MEIGFINGEFIDINKAVLPIDERGHQFGDGVYEVVKVYDSSPFLLDEHLLRLEKSASEIRINLPYTLHEVKKIIMDGLSLSQLQEAEIYFQVTRGIATRNHLFPKVPASFTMTIRPARIVLKQYYNDGISATLSNDERWTNCHIKSLNLLPNVIAKQKAFDSGYFEAILVTKDAYITEGTSSNIFVVKNNKLYTTPLTCNILPGITRAAVLAIAKEKQIIFKEESFSTTFLMDADEVFMTSTSVEILPICSVDHNLISNGKPGPITKSLYEAYSQLYSLKGVK
ncbi:D-amino-acid transaminase [Bacillus canaveralius]|uniref:D-alanine aminotransferase n=1 Tax=Bacillus canaveralius TaxID=1403243 RepID=A0A2N5GKT2_9BACI|nr:MULTISPECIES: D-amino-acid transaminase [Bacillus]PLR81469.1 D-amino-acid transaminase [Bacillus sp. V33-4]PLR82079.1 D-amino-acid transaminase [Bacillus canaveralius]PLR98015.1 D-amino-acid transaminase [Bacillus canaveralius]RSK54404.1 D-amino-acid transaminase [Bacillus canaveralius]